MSFLWCQRESEMKELFGFPEETVLLAGGLVLLLLGAVFGYMSGRKSGRESYRGTILPFAELELDRDFQLIGRGGEGGLEYAFIRDGVGGIRTVQGVPGDMPIGSIFVIRHTNGKRVLYEPCKWHHTSDTS